MSLEVLLITFSTLVDGFNKPLYKNFYFGPCSVMASTSHLHCEGGVRIPHVSTGKYRPLLIECDIPCLVKVTVDYCMIALRSAEVVHLQNDNKNQLTEQIMVQSIIMLKRCFFVVCYTLKKQINTWALSSDGQSISFASWGSWVRIPQGPQKVKVTNLKCPIPLVNRAYH